MMMIMMVVVVVLWWLEVVNEFVMVEDELVRVVMEVEKVC
jgi:hypothetical protein